MTNASVHMFCHYLDSCKARLNNGEDLELRCIGMIEDEDKDGDYHRVAKRGEEPTSYNIVVQGEEGEEYFDWDFNPQMTRIVVTVMESYLGLQANCEGG